MFKNFDKVFKFTFKNQISPKSYKIYTAVISAILILLPIVICLIAGSKMDDDDTLKSCGADTIYIVNEKYPDIEYSFLKSVDAPGYENIIFKNAKNVDEALASVNANSEVKSLIYEVTVDENGVSSNIIIPTISVVDKENAEHLNDFINEAGYVFTAVSMGISPMDLMKSGTPTQYNVYKADGYKKGTDLFSDDAEAEDKANQDILSGFRIAFVLINSLLIYMIVLLYGSSISQNIVMEKSSKLMDTMLVSVRPEAMILGKYLGVLCAGIMQIFIWGISLAAGLLGGVLIMKNMIPGAGVMGFVGNFSSMGLFTPVSLILSLLIIILGMLFYTAIAAICGAISSTKEEVASNQGIFVMLILVSFYMIIFGGALSGQDIPMWQNLVPFTSVMILPAGVCLGTVSVGIAVLSVVIMAACAVGMIILAGRLYKMMSLYKGDKVNIVKAFKMLAANKE